MTDDTQGTEYVQTALDVDLSRPMVARGGWPVIAAGITQRDGRIVVIHQHPEGDQPSSMNPNGSYEEGETSDMDVMNTPEPSEPKVSTIRLYIADGVVFAEGSELYLQKVMNTEVFGHYGVLTFSNLDNVLTMTVKQETMP